VQHVRLDRVARRVLASEAERAIDASMAGPLPEAVARSLVRHGVIDRVAREIAADVEWEEHFDDLVDRAVENPSFKRALEEVIASDAVRNALMRQTTSFGEETVDAVRARLADADERLATRSTSNAFGGVASRVFAFVLDAAIVQLAFAVAAGSIGLALSLFFTVHRGPVISTLGSILWVAFVIAYFVGFWSSTGQTLGLRLTGERVLRTDGSLVSPARAAVRLVALVLAIAVAFLGLATIPFDRRRRGVHDMVAGTVVVRGDQVAG
jgi:uncharacterized RDD family membrane protein YckC